MGQNPLRAPFSRRTERRAGASGRAAHEPAAPRPADHPEQQTSMMKQRSIYLFAAALLAAAAPAALARTGCDAKLDALDARIAEARAAHAEDRIARLRAVRERVRHFCAHGRAHASAAHASTPAAPTSSAPPDAASQPRARQPA
ncbi:hypothetical protein Bmul_2705 [Burkholderia multivorans ATCC 17616]|nr:hypothetical protein Bmul_2705 [Burkholderia multivorans ATCC 17616]